MGQFLSAVGTVCSYAYLSPGRWSGDTDQRGNCLMPCPCFQPLYWFPVSHLHMSVFYAAWLGQSQPHCFKPLQHVYTRPAVSLGPTLPWSLLMSYSRAPLASAGESRLREQGCASGTWPALADSRPRSRTNGLSFLLLPW